MRLRTVQKYLHTYFFVFIVRRGCVQPHLCLLTCTNFFGKDLLNTCSRDQAGRAIGCSFSSSEFRVVQGEKVCCFCADAILVLET